MLNNSVMNFCHVATAAGMPATMALRAAVISLVALGLLPLFRKASARLNMPQVVPWV
jgi:hypothetical protein